MIKHTFNPMFGSRYGVCMDCGQYYEEGEHYPYNEEDYLDIDDDFEENTVLNYETDEGGL